MTELANVIQADRLVKSRQRVADHGEVFTAEREVNAMLDLVKTETDRIDSRFLEPACGTGNFLIEVLQRKLSIVSSRYVSRRSKWEVYAAQAVSSIYGVDIQQDNVAECRHRLFELVDAQYTRLFSKHSTDNYRNVLRFLLERNILWGDALNLRTPDEAAHPIVFSEWGFVVGNRDNMVKRRDFRLHTLLEDTSDMPLFRNETNPTGIPEPINEYPLIPLLQLADESHPEL
ncbi:MAG: SAM-dependent DNA methyltransferase [Spirosoma sp.]|nr:SAM-dependent DNA methyltransferase [Spirosoma sp.]